MVHLAALLEPGRAFNRSDYAAAVGRGPDGPAVDAMLSRHARAGEIKHVVEDVFGALPKGCKKTTNTQRRLSGASRLRPGAVLAHHSALDLHAYAYSVTSCLFHAFAPSGPCEIVADGCFYDFFEPPPPPRPPSWTGSSRLTASTPSPSWCVDVRLTTLDRTVADLFVHPARGGSELIESIDSIRDLDVAALVRHARTLGDAAAGDGGGRPCA